MDNFNTVKIYSYDQTYIQIIAEKSIIKELYDHFTFKIKDAHFNPKVKARLWDGKIRLLNLATQRIYKGLLSHVVAWCNDNGYSVELDSELIQNENLKITQNIQTFIDSIKLNFEPYSFQKPSAVYCLKNKRALVLSPTGSGKSLIIYYILRYLLEKSKFRFKILLCVPSIDLVEQLLEEFIEYDKTFPIQNYVHQIYSGKEKQTQKQIVISTWQSIYEYDSKYFSQWNAVIIDEAHQAKADSLKKILESSVNAKYKIGLTGTIDNLEVDKLVIEGLTGPIYTTTTTHEMMKAGQSSQLEVKILLLNHTSKLPPQNMSFQSERKYLVQSEIRNNFIANLIKKYTPNKNILVLTDSRNHILLLKKALEAKEIDKNKIIIVTGSTDKDERKLARHRAEKENGLIFLATFGVYSTGINIKNLQYLIFATGTKAWIKLLQSIGRLLRKDGKDNFAILFDIADRFDWKTIKRNHSYNHFFKRVSIYINQKFSYKIIKINI